MAGALAAWITRFSTLSNFFESTIARALSLGLALAGLISTKYFQSASATDLIFGLSVSSTLPVAAKLPTFGTAYQSTARAAAEISYTLYLTHFPFLTLIVMSSMAPFRFSSSDGVFVYFVFLTCSMLMGNCILVVFRTKH